MRYLLILLALCISIPALTQEEAVLEDDSLIADETSVEEEEKKSNDPFDINVPITTDRNPSFKLGTSAMGNLLHAPTSGTVTVAMRIQPDGKASDIEILEGMDPSTNEMVRFLLASETFNPNIQNGRATSSLVVFNLPIGTGTE